MPNSPRELAERILDGSQWHDADEATALIEADRAATREAAIRECIAVIGRMWAGGPTTLRYSTLTDARLELRALLPPAPAKDEQNA